MSIAQSGRVRVRVACRRRMVFAAIVAGALPLPPGGAMALPASHHRNPTVGADVGTPKTQPTPVTLAEVTSGIDITKTNLPDATTLLRQDMETEIAALDWSRDSAPRRYQLSASLVKLESTVEGKTLRTACAVLVSIRDAKNGNLLAMLEGRARVDDAASAIVAAERDALAAAARGAVTRVQDAIRRLP